MRAGMKAFTTDLKDSLSDPRRSPRVRINLAEPADPDPVRSKPQDYM